MVNKIKTWTDGVPVEYSAMQQLKDTASLPIIYKHIAVMPDVHFGRGSTVGSVIPTKNAIIPAAVGVDIGCVDKDTEFLSQSGWKKISEYNGEDILIYNVSKQTAYFHKPEKYIIRKNDKGFIHFKNKYGINKKVSFDHKMLVYQYTRKYDFSNAITVKAIDLLNKHNSLANGFRHRINTAPENIILNNKLNISDDLLRVIIMVCADGHYYSSGNKCVCRFKKERKINRCKQLLRNANISITHENIYSNGITSLTFIKPTESKILSQLWSSSLDQLKIITDEVMYWDGNQEEKCFYSSKKEEADFVHYCFMACGYRSVLRIDRNNEYRVFKHENTKIGLNGSPKTNFNIVPSQDDKEYCFTVESGFFIIRNEGQISITGNCGMCAIKTSLSSFDLPESLVNLRNDIEDTTPVGFNSHSDVPKSSENVWYSLLKKDYEDIERKNPKFAPKKSAAFQLGTLGGGNHFIELCLDEDDSVWVMLHSGSRNIGNRIGTYFIAQAKEEMEKLGVSVPNRDLSYLNEGTEHFNDYVEAVDWAQKYALVNRDMMMEQILRVLVRNFKNFALTSKAVNCHHNYVQKEEHFGEKIWLTRKGAVSAKKGELGIIPGSMGARSFIVKGKGNIDSFHSCSHGAGRVMSRGQAKKTFTVEDHELATKGVECRKDFGVIDETPGAYKNIDDVMNAQKDLVEIVHTLKQVMCVKG